ncbi:MAG: aliphatic sulfonate ABC transporter substrate-binding protein [Clostridiaceae bacterium]
MRKKFTTLSIILAASLIISGCAKSASATKSTEVKRDKIDFTQKSKVSTVKIGFPNSGKGAPGGTFGIALEKGYLDEEFNKIGVKVEAVNVASAGPGINEALAGNKLDLGIYGDTPAIIAKSANIDTTLVGIGTIANAASLVVSSKSDIKSVKELKGKKVAVQKGTYMHRTLAEMLNSVGLKESDIQFYNMNSTDGEAALLGGTIDAIVEGDSSAFKLVAAKTGRIILNCNKNPEWKGANLVISRTDFAKENPQVIVALLKALDKAKNFTDKNPEETKVIWAKSGTSKQIYDQLYPSNDFKLNVELNKESLNFVDRTKKFLIDDKLINKDFDINEWADNRYYEEAIKK